MIIKIIIILMFVVILISLGAALYYLIQDRGTTKRTVNALTVRIAISVSIILLLILGYYSGVIQPHGIGG